jgi:hypothetical protein
MSGIACQGQTPKRKTCPMNPRFLGSWRHVEIARAVSANLRGVFVHIRRRWQSFQEEGEYEYVAYHKDGSPEHQEARLEPAVLYQPLKAEAGPAGEGEGGSGESEGFRIPIAGGCPSTKDPCYKHIRHHGGSANEGACPNGQRSCGRPAGGGPEAVKNICIFDWWNPVGWVCGAAAAGKAAYEAAHK